MDIFEAIKNRRSVRRYKTDPIDEKRIEAVLEAGRWAPSWANTQCGRFIVVCDAKVRAELAATLQNIKLPDREVPNPATRALDTVPVIIAVCAKIGISGASHSADGTKIEYETDKGDWFMFDTALAVQNMALAAHAQGLGTVIVGAFDAVRAGKVLGLPGGYRVVALMPLGVPEQPGKAPPRKELKKIAFKDKFGRPL